MGQRARSACRSIMERVRGAPMLDRFKNLLAIPAPRRMA
jgi:hypothetical protein